MAAKSNHISVACPHCRSRARARTSREETPLVREARFQCSNVECGHTFVVKLEITSTIAPSQMPNPDIILPITPASLRRSIAIAPFSSGLAVPHAPPAIAAAGH